MTQLFKSFTNQRVHVIATITPSEYKAFFKRLIKLDPDIDKIFERIEIEEPEKQITVQILHDLRKNIRFYPQSRIRMNSLAKFMT